MPRISCFSRRSFRSLAILACGLILTLGARATIGVGLQMQSGNPTGATVDPNNHTHYLMDRAHFALDYSDTLREANWVAWNLTAGDTASGRSDAFAADPDLPSTFVAIQSNGYSGSGYDRGHMCPSADRNVTMADNAVTFYMTNMVPQTPDNNQGVWNNFESYCRSQAAAGNELLILSGPGGFGGSTIASGVAIPGYIWKIVLVVPLGSGSAVSRINTSTRVIAIKVPNIAGIRNNPWAQYVTSIAQIEADTGFTFLSAVPSAVASVLRTKVDGQTSTGAPTISVQPTPQSAPVNGNATFAVTASDNGNPPLTYQWLKGDSEIGGATNASLTLTGVQPTDAGNYSVIVTNPVSSVTSDAAALIVTGIPASIGTQPVAQSVAAGSTVTFSVTAAGSPPFSYQWRKAGSPLSNGGNVSGATTATLTLTNVQDGDVGSYDVVVSNTVPSSATSNAVLLSVTPAAPAIVAQPQPRSSTPGGTATFTVGATGTAPLTYQWRKGSSPLVDGPNIAGATTASLTLSNLAEADAGSYDVQVSGPVGSPVISQPASLTVSTTNTIYWDFASANPTSGVPADVTGVSGAPIVLTQNSNNGTTALITSVSVSSGYSGASGTNNAGAAARTGALNRTASGSAYFEVTLVPTAGKRLTVSALSFGSRSTGTGPQAYSLFASADGYTAPIATGTFANNSAWVLHTPTFGAITGVAGDPVTLRLYGHGGTGSPGVNTANWRIDDLKITVSTGVALPAVASFTPAAGATGVALNSPITVTFNSPVTVGGSWFSIASAANGAIPATVTSTDAKTFTLTPPTNFAYNDTITVTFYAAQISDQATGTQHPAANTTFAFTTSAALAPTITTDPTPQTVAAGSTATFSVVATGTAPLSYQWRKAGVAIVGNPSASTATLTLPNVQAGDMANYDVVVSNGVNPAATSAAVALTVTPTAPSIVTQPTPQSVAVGGSASFTVAATGTTPFTYQWRKNGTPISGNASAATATLTLSPVQAGDGASYDVVVSNGIGSAVTSNAVALTVTGLPFSPLGYIGGAYAQNFNTLPSTGTFTLTSNGPIRLDDPAGINATGLAGWSFARYSGSGSVATFRVDTGAGNAGAVYSYGSATAANDRALGSIASGSVVSRFGLTLVNNTGQTITQFTLNYTGEQWREGGGTVVVPNKLAFSYAVGVSNINTGTFTAVTGLDFTAPIATTTISALDGNAPANRIVVPAVVVSGFTWEPGQTLVLRWTDMNDDGNDDGLAIDDLTFSTPVLPPAAPTIDTQPIAQTATVGDMVTFTVQASGTAPLSYRWRKGGVNLDNGTAVSGATTATLTLTNITTADQGSYDCLVSNVYGDKPSDAAALTVNKATATITFGPLAFTYDGAPHAATATTSPAALALSFTYNGSTAAPANAGSYAVVATITDPNYTGSANGTLVIAPAAATIALSGLTATYDGAPHAATATTTPAGLAVAITYGGNTTAPTNAGSYAVAATIADANYVGSTSGMLIIAKATAAVALSQLTQTYDGAPKPVTVTTTPASLPVAVGYNGSATVPSAAGSYSVVATVNHANYAGSTMGTLVINAGSAAIVLSDLRQNYDGLPKPVTVTTTPAGLTYTLTYNGSATAPTNPGSYAVVATLTDANYTGSANGTLVIGVTALVRHAPTLNGGLDGSLQVLLPESFTLNSSGWVSGDILVPGTPTVRLNGSPTFAGVVDGAGSATPANHQITLNGGAVARYIFRRTDAIAMPVVATPPRPAGTRHVVLSSAAQGPGDFATLLNLTANGNVGDVSVPPGTYGKFTANGASNFVLGIAGASTPAVYNLQFLTLNGNAQLKIVGPVVINLAYGVTINGRIGADAHPEWLTLNVANGGVTLNGNVTGNAYIVAPSSNVIINGGTTLNGGVIADRLTINGNGVLNQP